MKAQAISYLLCSPSMYEICVLWALFCFVLFFLMKKLSEGRVGDVDKLYIKIGNRTSIWVSRQAAGQEAPFHIRVSEFGSLILALTPASCQWSPWWAAVMIQAVGSLLPFGETWIAFPASGSTHHSELGIKSVEWKEKEEAVSCRTKSRVGKSWFLF